MCKSHLIIALLAGSALAACQRASIDTPPLGALPPAAGPAAPLALAPTATALPPAPPPRLAGVSGPGQGYAYADRAWAMSDALGDSPPDYTFADDGVTPWVWTADDHSECIAEAVPGGERYYYYYEPGADEPYYVQDSDYGYGYDDGALVVVFDTSGRELPPDQFASRADFAGRFLARGEALRRAASSDQHQPVAAANWNARRAVFADQRQAWSQEAASNPDWSAYHTQYGAQEQAHWSTENARRETWAAQTDARLGDSARASREHQLAAAAQHPSPGYAAQRPFAAPGASPAGQPGGRGAIAGRSGQLASNQPDRFAGQHVMPSGPQPQARPLAQAPRESSPRALAPSHAYAPAAGPQQAQRRTTEPFVERHAAPTPQASGATTIHPSPRAQTAEVRTRPTQSFAAAHAPEARAAVSAGVPAAAHAPAQHAAVERAPAAPPHQGRSDPKKPQ